MRYASGKDEHGDPVDRTAVAPRWSSGRYLEGARWDYLHLWRAPEEDWHNRDEGPLGELVRPVVRDLLGVDRSPRYLSAPAVLDCLVRRLLGGNFPLPRAQWTAGTIHVVEGALPCVLPAPTWARATGGAVYAAIALAALLPEADELYRAMATRVTLAHGVEVGYGP